jgi:hypothetical protein
MLLLLAALLAAAAPCPPIHFARGKSSATIEGAAPPAKSVCYTLAVRPGQTVDIHVISAGTNVGATVPGVGDVRDHFHFQARQASYTIGLGQLFPAPSSQAFSMTVSVR